MSILQNILAIMKAKKPSVLRSSQWVKIRAEHLKNNPICAVCGENKKLEVHHIRPFHLDPTLELDPANLITLCEIATGGVICHLFVGHNSNYKFWNENIVEDAEYLRNMLANRKGP